MFSASLIVRRWWGSTRDATVTRPSASRRSSPIVGRTNPTSTWIVTRRPKRSFVRACSPSTPTRASASIVFTGNIRRKSSHPRTRVHWDICPPNATPITPNLVRLGIFRCVLVSPYTGVDKESKKIISARILSKLVVSVAKGNSNYVSKFQLSSSNSLGDMRIFVTEIDD